MSLFALVFLTLRELWARKIVAGLLIVSTLAWVMLAFALNLDIVEGSLAGVKIFGLGDDGPPTNGARDPETGEIVRTAITLEGFVVAIEQFVAGASYWIGTLLGLFATAPLIAGMLTPGQIDLLLAKPMSRSRVLTGHLLAVGVVMVGLTTYLYGMVWLTMSLKTGIWHWPFLKAIFVVIGMYAVMYSIVVLIGVTTRSTALSLTIAYGVVFASVVLQFEKDITPQINLPWRAVFQGFYHSIPHFAEVTPLVVQLAKGEVVASWYPFYGSLAIGLACYAAAFAYFKRRDF